MANLITNFKLFLESYSEELDEILSNPENRYVVLKEEEIIAGFELLDDAFSHLSEVLESESILSEEERYEFDDEASLMLPSLGEEPDQIEIEDVLNTLLDKFNILEPYKIITRIDLEETPIDTSDDIDMSEEEEAETFLSENADPSLDFAIVGFKGGDKKSLEFFDSEEEANSFLPEYSVVYDDYDELKVVHKTKI